MCVTERRDSQRGPRGHRPDAKIPFFEGDSPRAQWMLDGVAVTGHPLTTYIALCTGHSTGLAPDCALSQVDRQTQNEATQAGGE